MDGTISKSAGFGEPGTFLEMVPTPRNRERTRNDRNR